MNRSSPPVEVVAGLLRRDGRVLLGHRRADRRHYPDVWDLPGGHIDEDENPVDALVRELGEELGITARVDGEVPWVTLTGHGVRLHVYLVDDWSGEIRNAAPEEHDELRWVGPDELGELPLADPSYADLLRSATGVAG